MAQEVTAKAKVPRKIQEASVAIRDANSSLNATRLVALHLVVSRDAEHDVEAEVDGERKLDAGLSTAGREGRLSRAYGWSMLLAQDGAGLLGHHSL